MAVLARPRLIVNLIVNDKISNQGIIKCHVEQIDEIEVVSNRVMVLVVPNMAKSNI